MAEKKKSKRYRSLVKDFDKNNSLKIEEAVKVIKEKSKAKFVESFDVCFSLAVDKTKPDSVLRTTVDLPNGNGKKIKIAVICSNDKVEEAKSAGAEIAGSDDLIETINSGKIDFDDVGSKYFHSKRNHRIANPFGTMDARKKSNSIKKNAFSTFCHSAILSFLQIRAPHKVGQV